MTRKDYVEVARICRDLRRFHSTYDADGFAVVRMSDVENALASFFKSDNASFDKDRFIAAIGSTIRQE